MSEKSSFKTIWVVEEYQVVGNFVHPCEQDLLYKFQKLKRDLDSEDALRFKLEFKGIKDIMQNLFP